MGFFTEQTYFFEILIFITTFLVSILSYFHHRYQYWNRRNVPFIPPRFPFGNISFCLPKSLTVGKITKTFYDHFKANQQKFGGVFLITEPNLVLTDPDLIKDILCKDFYSFVDRGFYFNEKDDPISANLFAIDGTHWKNLRMKLTPTFTSLKMKIMFETVVECSDNMIDFIETNFDKNEDIDIKEVLGKFTTDVIGSCAFGIECNSFKHPDAEFRQMGKKIFHFDFWRSVRAFFIINLPKLALKLGVAGNNREVRDFFTKTVVETIKLRKETNTKRNDFLQILIDLEETMNFTLNEIIAQVFLFFVAGFETSSGAMTFALYELARNPEIQKKLREEIFQILKKHDNKLTYVSLKEMTYLGQVFDETLRLWPIALTLNRRCTQEYTIPGTDIVLEKNTPILIPVFGLHRDPEYYPNPEEFNPERFSEEKKKKRHSSVYLPFGDGPRNCIGKRFGLMQSKIGIAQIVKNFKISLSSETKEIEIEPNKFILGPINPIYLRVERV